MSHFFQAESAQSNWGAKRILLGIQDCPGQGSSPRHGCGRKMWAAINSLWEFRVKHRTLETSAGAPSRRLCIRQGAENAVRSCGNISRSTIYECILMQTGWLVNPFNGSYTVTIIRVQISLISKDQIWHKNYL